MCWMHAGHRPNHAVFNQDGLKCGTGLPTRSLLHLRSSGDWDKLLLRNQFAEESVGGRYFDFKLPRTLLLGVNPTNLGRGDRATLL